MANENTGATWHFHNGTKHPGGQLLDPGHVYLDSMRPHLFKEYVDLKPESLPMKHSTSELPLLEAIAVNRADFSSERAVDLETLTGIFYYSAGITKTLVQRDTGNSIPFRAAACTGALFHIEIYLICGDVAGLDAGVYHLDPRGPSLRQLRKGDYRGALIEASGSEPEISRAPASFVLTSDIGRNAIKYQARAYRHAFWDSGTMLANTFAIAAAYQLPAKVVTGFVDEQINQLLGIDGQREFALALVPVGGKDDQRPQDHPTIQSITFETSPFTSFAIDYSAIRSMHYSSSLPAGSVAAWRQGRTLRRPPPEVGDDVLVPLESPPRGDLPTDPVETVIQRRGSTRRFDREPVSFSQLSSVLCQSLQGIPADFITSPGETLNDVYLTVQAVDGLASGSYVLRKEQSALELLQEGDFRQDSRHLALGQDLAGDAAVNIFFLTDLEPVLERYGNRGYRVAQLEASIAAGRMYLAAYAQQFGATGLTFYDDQVTDFFSPDAARKSVMFMVALGHPAYRTR